MNSAGGSKEIGPGSPQYVPGTGGVSGPAQQSPSAPYPSGGPTLDSLKSALIQMYGEDAGTKLYNGFLSTMELQMLQQMQQSAQDAQSAAQSMRDQDAP